MALVISSPTACCSRNVSRSVVPIRSSHSASAVRDGRSDSGGRQAQVQRAGRVDALRGEQRHVVAVPGGADQQLDGLLADSLGRGGARRA